MKYKYISTIDRAWKGRLWFSDTPKLLTEEEAGSERFIRPYFPRRVVLRNGETIQQYCEARNIHPSVVELLLAN
jgi:hypothetical protein